MSCIDFTGRVAIVTGSGGGLGRTYALEMAARGASVVVNDLGGSFDGKGGSHSMADQVVAEIIESGGKAVANYDSVATREGGENIVATAINNFGRVDILINNAGHLRNASFEDISDDIFDSLIDVHLKGAFYVSQPAYRIMKEQGYGRIIFASSSAGILGNKQQAAYGAAKAGLLGLMNVLALEGEEHGVLCNALLPVADTRMAAAMDPKLLDESQAIYAALGDKLGMSFQREFVTPLVTYLASEACKITKGIYSAALGRYAKAVIAMGNGWYGPRDTPASAEDIAEHLEQICDLSDLNVPRDLLDEFKIIGKQF